jgi:hypothetical protein
MSITNIWGWYSTRPKLLSIGDKLTEGTYKVHSRFERAVNFENDGMLATLACENIGGGPINIVTRGMDFSNTELLIVGDRCLWIDNEEYHFNKDDNFSSDIEIHTNFAADNFLINISVLENSLIAFSPSRSLVFLLDPIRKADFQTLFELEFAKRFEQGVEIIFRLEYIEGVKMIRGLGFGLTPSGDDFIAGMLVAYNIAGKLSGSDYSERIEQIYSAAIGTNLISNSFLRCAKSGWLTEKQKALVKTMMYSDEGRVIQKSLSLIELGETSGADWGVGFVMTLKNNYGLG